MIAERPEFKIYLQQYGNSRSTRSRKDESTAGRADSPVGEKVGLDWVMALARVELAAMLSAFSHVHKPFHDVSPTEFERQAMGEILLSDADAHIRELERDVNVTALLDDVRKFSPVNTMSYIRRMKMVSEMTAASASFPDPSLRQSRFSCSR